MAIIALAVLPLLTPWFIHPALDAAGSAERLAMTAAQSHTFSDRSVGELVLGPGAFDFTAPDGRPFYDVDERRHLSDARTLLGIFLIAGGLGLIAIAALSRVRAGRAEVWLTVARAGAVTAVGVVVVGIVALVAFDSLFTLFHQVFFPGGNWSFDPSSQRLVQLYPFGFWQIAAGALGALVFLLGLGTWLLGRWAARRSGASSAASATEV